MATRTHEPTARFAGIPAEAFDFYDALSADPTKSFWESHKQDYVDAVKAPLQALTRELEPEFGAAHLYRPYRDVRFSRDKTPYKTLYGVSTCREPLTCGLAGAAGGLVGAWGVAGPQLTGVPA